MLVGLGISHVVIGAIIAFSIDTAVDGDQEPDGESRRRASAPLVTPLATSVTR